MEGIAVENSNFGGFYLSFYFEYFGSFQARRQADTIKKEVKKREN